MTDVRWLPGHWCDFCQTNHSARRCFHPGRALTWQPIETHVDTGVPVVVWNGQPWRGFYQAPDGWFADVDGEMLRIDPPPTHWIAEPT